MPGTFSDSWKLTKTSFRLIAEDRALLVFPVVAGVSILGVFALFLLGALVLLPGIEGGGSTVQVDYLLGFLLFVAVYFVSTFISVYCTAALIGAATMKLNGQQPTAADGWRVARTRLARLLAWAVITATVGLIIQLIASRVRGIGGLLIAGIGGASWSLITYFAIPVVMYEDLAAWASLKRSGQLFISAFGRSLVTNLVLSLILGAGLVGAVLLGVAGLFVWAGGSVVLGVILVVGGVTLAVLVALIGAAAEGVLRAALYRYATTGRIDPGLLPAAYQPGMPGSTNAPLP
jgi:Family of unknown function (DUF6159)